MKVIDKSLGARPSAWAANRKVGVVGRLDGSGEGSHGAVLIGCPGRERLALRSASAAESDKRDGHALAIRQPLRNKRRIGVTVKVPQDRLAERIFDAV
jgi:hypothetical protein